MKKMLIAFSILVPCLLTLTSVATAQTNLKVAAGEVWGSTVRDGSWKSNPTASTLGLALILPISQSWSWYSESGLATPNSKFHPSPRTIQGPSYRLSKITFIGLTAAYQFNPGHGEVEWSHLLGAGPFTAINISREVGLTFVLAGGKSLRQDGPWSVVFQPRVSFALPL